MTGERHSLNFKSGIFRRVTGRRRSKCGRNGMEWSVLLPIARELAIEIGALAEVAEIVFGERSHKRILATASRGVPVRSDIACVAATGASPLHTGLVDEHLVRPVKAVPCAVASVRDRRPLRSFRGSCRRHLQALDITHALGLLIGPPCRNGECVAAIGLGGGDIDEHRPRRGGRDPRELEVIEPGTSTVGGHRGIR
jgi:hypothetical protein